MTLDIEGVLAGHRSLIHVGLASPRWPRPPACTCGWEDGFVPDAMEAHRAHVAAVLREQIEVAQAEAAKAATAGSLRYAAGLIFGQDEELAETLYRVADEAAAYDFAEDLPCCPICEEVICDDGCPFEPYRAAQVACVDPSRSESGSTEIPRFASPSPSRVPGEGS